MKQHLGLFVLGLIAPALSLAASVQPVGFGVGIYHYEGNTIVASQGQSGLNSASITTCVVSTAARQVCGAAFAVPGILGSESSLIVPDPLTIASGSAESANGDAVFTDILTITGLSPGTYSLIPIVTVHGGGTWDNAALPQTIGLGINEFGPDGTTIIYSTFPDATQTTYVNTLTLAGIVFEPGVPFNLKLQFGTAARIYNGSVPSQNTAVHANFLSTLALSGLEVRDANGAVVPFSSLTLVSGSGATYDATGVTPEPSSVVLVMSAIALALVRLRPLKLPA